MASNFWSSFEIEDPVTGTRCRPANCETDLPAATAAVQHRFGYEGVPFDVRRMWTKINPLGFWTSWRQGRCDLITHLHVLRHAPAIIYASGRTWEYEKTDADILSIDEILILNRPAHLYLELVLPLALNHQGRVDTPCISGFCRTFSQIIRALRPDRVNSQDMLYSLDICFENRFPGIQSESLLQNLLGFTDAGVSTRQNGRRLLAVPIRDLLRKLDEINLRGGRRFGNSETTN
jgi:hypothetical protein